MPAAEGFPKAEHLCSRRLIEQLYTEGKHLRCYPYSIQLRIVDEEPLCQTLIVAPKRHFRHAVDRNRQKRLTRECFRRTKAPLYECLKSQQRHLNLALVYTGSPLPYSTLLQRMEKAIDLIIKELNSL